MTAGVWVLLVAVVAALGFGAWRAANDGRFRGTRRVRGAGGFETGAGRPPQPPADGAVHPPQPAADRAGSGPSEDLSVLAGTAYDERRGERATLLQFSSAFCAPCRAARRTLADVARTVPGVAHVEVDAEHHLELVRALGVLRTPTTLVLDAHGREVVRATGAPRPAQVIAALGESL